MEGDPDLFISTQHLPVSWAEEGSGILSRTRAEPPHPLSHPLAPPRPRQKSSVDYTWKATAVGDDRIVIYPDDPATIAAHEEVCEVTQEGRVRRVFPTRFYVAIYSNANATFRLGIMVTGGKYHSEGLARVERITRNLRQVAGDDVHQVGTGQRFALDDLEEGEDEGDDDDDEQDRVFCSDGEDDREVDTDDDDEKEGEATIRQPTNAELMEASARDVLRLESQTEREEKDIDRASLSLKRRNSAVERFDVNEAEMELVGFAGVEVEVKEEEEEDGDEEEEGEKEEELEGEGEEEEGQYAVPRTTHVRERDSPFCATQRRARRRHRRFCHGGCAQVSTRVKSRLEQ